VAITATALCNDTPANPHPPVVLQHVVIVAADLERGLHVAGDVQSPDLLQFFRGLRTDRVAPVRPVDRDHGGAVGVVGDQYFFHSCSPLDCGAAMLTGSCLVGAPMKCV
jgi:hypothetical protein